jgi:hypothetical protein
VISNRTGKPVFFWRSVAPSTAYPCGAMSSTLSATTSQPRGLLSIARLNVVRSRASLYLQLRPDRPDVLWSQRGLCADWLSFVSSDALGCVWDKVLAVLHGGAPQLLRVTIMRARRSAFGHSTRGGEVEYWTVATRREAAVWTVPELVAPGSTRAALTDRRLTQGRVAELKLRPMARAS